MIWVVEKKKTNIKTISFSLFYGKLNSQVLYLLQRYTGVAGLVSTKQFLSDALPLHTFPLLHTGPPWAESEVSTLLFATSPPFLLTLVFPLLFLTLFVSNLVVSAFS